jgi:hypothetical protein
VPAGTPLSKGTTHPGGAWFEAGPDGFTKVLWSITDSHFPCLRMYTTLTYARWVKPADGIAYVASTASRVARSRLDGSDRPGTSRPSRIAARICR